MKDTDTEFTATLTAYLAQFSEGHKPLVPLFKNDDGSIDRGKTLALPCYMNERAWLGEGTTYRTGEGVGHIAE